MSIVKSETGRREVTVDRTGSLVFDLKHREGPNWTPGEEREEVK